MAVKTRLTGKQKLFALHYAACLNQTEAARLAGYKAKSDATFRAIGHENLAKPHIRAEIDRLLHQRTMQPIEVLARLSEQATGDYSDFFDVRSSGEPVFNLSKAIERGKLHLIKKINFSEKTGDLKSIELHDPQAALVHLGKAYGLFKDKLEIDDWRTKVIEDVRTGLLTIEQVIQAFGTKQDLIDAIGEPSLAAQLFAAGGIPAQS